MLYNIGNIGIRIHKSNPDWTHKTYRTLNRQLDGFQIQQEFNSSTSYWLNFYDYATLSIKQGNADIIVPKYCYYSDGVYVDTQQKIAIKLHANTLDVWCSAGCKNVSIPFLLQSLLLSQGKTFVHAAAISIDGSGILLPAFGGIGKTSFIAKAIKKPGVQLFGDDMIIINKQGLIEPYLRPFALYEYHRTLFPDFFANSKIEYKPLTLSWRIYNKTRSIIGNSLGHDWYQDENVVRTGYIPVAPAHIFPPQNLANTSAKLDHIYLLQRSATVSSVTIKRLEAEKATTFMQNVMYHEWHSQLRFLLSWLTHRSIPVTSYFSHVNRILRTTVTNSQSINLIYIPDQMVPTDVAEELVNCVF